MQIKKMNPKAAAKAANARRIPVGRAAKAKAKAAGSKNVDQRATDWPDMAGQLAPVPTQTHASYTGGRDTPEVGARG